MEIEMQGNQPEFWPQVLTAMKSKMPAMFFETIMLKAYPREFEDGKLVILLPFAYMLRRINQKEKSLLESIVAEILGQPVRIEFLVEEEPDSVKSTRLAIEAQNLISKRKSMLTSPDEKPLAVVNKPNGKEDEGGHLFSEFTFENFVVGDNSRMAHAAAVAVARKPGKAYNPLFLYGGVGLGKTHLLHAIGHFVKHEFPHLIVRCLQAETYTNELVDAIGDKQCLKRFRAKYRHCDLLLIDDIHFLIDKEATQEAFFHTFNVLFELQKQVVLTSDRHPRELRTLKERLINRIHLGLIVDIQKPTYETRLAILRKKAAMMQLAIAPEILELYAEEVQGSIRSLEGCLKATKNTEKSYDKKISLDDARKIAFSYSESGSASTHRITLRLIMDLICHHYRISAEELLSASRESHVAHPRHIGMYLARKHTNHSLKEIARAFNKKDHATVFHGVKRIEVSMNTDAVLSREVSYIEDLLMGKSPRE
jgi:chromosomal replication initiator protein